MTEVLNVHVFGLPVPQARPRAFKTPSGHIRLYDPANCKDWKRTVLAQVLPAKPSAPVEGPLAMDLVFELPRPKSAPKRVQHPTTRPDLSNFIKTIEDALTGVVYRDDSQIVALTAIKRYGPEPGVSIRVTHVIAHLALS